MEAKTCAVDVRTKLLNNWIHVRFSSPGCAQKLFSPISAPRYLQVFLAALSYYRQPSRYSFRTEPDSTNMSTELLYLPMYGFIPFCVDVCTLTPRHHSAVKAHKPTLLSFNVYYHVFSRSLRHCHGSNVRDPDVLPRFRTILTLFAPKGELLQQAKLARPAFLHPAASYSSTALVARTQNTSKPSLIHLLNH